MTDFPNLSFALNDEILTFHLPNLKKGPLSFPPAPVTQIVQRQIINCLAVLSITPQSMNAFTHYSDILRAQVICAMKRTKVIIRLFKIHLAFGISPYFLL